MFPCQASSNRAVCPYQTWGLFFPMPLTMWSYLRPLGFSQGLSYLAVRLASSEFNPLPADELSAKVIPAQFARLSQHWFSEGPAVHCDATLPVMPVDKVSSAHISSFNSDSGLCMVCIFIISYFHRCGNSRSKVSYQGHMVNKFQSLDLILDSRNCMPNHCALGSLQSCPYF